MRSSGSSRRERQLIAAAMLFGAVFALSFVAFVHGQTDGLPPLDQDLELDEFLDSEIGDTTTISTLSTAATSAAAGAVVPSSSEAKPAEKTDAPADEGKSDKTPALVKHFENGGPVMWPLLISLLIALGFATERGIVFWRGSINVREFMTKIDELIGKGKTDAAVELCEKTRGPISAVIKAGLLRWDKGRKQVEKAIETAGSGAMSKMERGLPVLASVANIAPLMGFLGTVTGMIKSFGVIAQAGLSNPGLVAKGISEALITTASGLIIAIPALAAYNYFTSVVAKSALRMEESTSQLLDHLK